MNHSGFRLLLVVSCPVLLLASCASVNNKAYQRDGARPIRTVRISQEVQMPEKMLFYGFSESLMVSAGAGLGGAVGGALLGGATISRDAPADFGVPGSVRSAFAAEIQETGKFSIVAGSPADAELKLRVREYGFYQAGFMRRGVKPVMSVQAQLIRHDGAVAWEQNSFVTFNARGTPANLPERMRENPALAAEALRSAARLVAAKAVQTLEN